MTDAMVTARMSQSKKDAGNKILYEHGMTASQAINELYDYLLETHTWPLASNRKAPVTPEALIQALAHIDDIAQVSPSDYIDMSIDEAKQQRLLKKSYATESDFYEPLA